jgi:hypothetical protein
MVGSVPGNQIIREGSSSWLGEANAISVRNGFGGTRFDNGSGADSVFAPTALNTV